MNTKSIIEIFRGDDSDALGYQTIVGTIHTDLDLTGCKAVFRYLGFFQEFDPIPEDKKLTIVIPSASSMQFPPGFGYASLKVYDIDRKVRTFTNRIPVFVKTMTPCMGGGEFDVEFSPFPELAPLKIFKGPNAEDFDLYTGFVSKIIDRASAEKYGLSMLFDAMDAEKTAEGGCAASPAAVKAAYDAVIGMLTDNYYTKTETDEAIDKLAAYYITSDTQGTPFATHAALVNAQTYYSGGSVRVPTRNDYAIVVADETHDNEEWRYIYAVNEQDVGQWEPQYAVEGVITFDDNVTRTSGNGVKSSGIWSALWGALSALPTGFTSLYDWVVSKLSEYRDKLDLNVYSFGNASVTFPRGYSITDGYITYRPGGTGGVDETITFIGPVPSSNQYTPNDKYYYPSSLGTLDSFDPNDYSVWCLVCNNGVTIPSYMMYKTGPYYNIGSFNSETPTLTLGFGEATGDAPIMARPLGATGDTLAKVSQIPAIVAPSTSSSVSGKAADAKATGDELNRIARNWLSGDDYDAYDVVKYNDVYYYAKNDIEDSQTAPSSDTTNWGALPNFAAIVHKFLPLTGGAISGNVSMDGVLEFTSGGRVIIKDGMIIISDNNGATGTNFYIQGIRTPNHNAPLLFPNYTDGDYFATLENLAPDFSTSATYAVNALCVYNGVLYRCTTAVTTAGAWTGSTNWAEATVEDVLAALRTGKQDALSQQQLDNIAAVPNKANASDLRYAISESTPLTVTSGAASTTLADRTHNVRTVAAPGSGSTTTITATLPPIVAGKSRDMFLNLTVGTQASDAGDISLSIVEPSGATVQIEIGSVEDIGVGKNEILISEIALPTTSGNTTTTHWLVTVRHEDLAS